MKALLNSHTGVGEVGVQGGRRSVTTVCNKVDTQVPKFPLLSFSLQLSFLLLSGVPMQQVSAMFREYYGGSEGVLGVERTGWI